MSTDISIVIPNRGPGLGLWATIHSCEEDLLDSKYTYNYVVVTNGGKVSTETKSTLSFLEETRRLKAHVHFDEAITPPVARQRGVEVSDGKVLCFFDDHCLVAKRYFDRVMAHMEAGKVDLLHSATKFHSGDGTHLHYKLKLDYNFWGEGCKQSPYSPMPYKIAMAGHGGFAIKKETWLEVGGYGPDNLLSGYGGEEPLFDLKMWRLGKNNWLDPKLIHWHFPGDRGYTRHFTDQYYTNLLVAANVIGGEKWLYKVFDSFLTKNHIRPVVRGGKSFYEILEDAVSRSSDYAKQLDTLSVRTLDECLDYFKANQVEH